MLYFELLAAWIEAAFDRLELEPGEVQDLTITLPDAGGIVTVCVGNREAFLWNARTTQPYAYWINDYDEIARGRGAV